jgi:hypothetical protein
MSSFGQDLGDDALVAVRVRPSCHRREMARLAATYTFTIWSTGAEFIAALHAVEASFTGIDRLFDGRPHQLVDLLDLWLGLRRTEVEFLDPEGRGRSATTLCS